MGEGGTVVAAHNLTSDIHDGKCRTVNADVDTNDTCFDLVNCLY